MRTLFASLLLAVLALTVRAQEGDPTAQLPKDAQMAVRLASIDRVDAIFKDWLPTAKALGLDVRELEQMPLSNYVFLQIGLANDVVDRTKPVYLGVNFEQEQPLVAFHPGAGAAWEGKKELAEGACAVRRGGVVVLGESPALDQAVRGATTTFRIDGDVVVHFYLAEIVAAHKKDIEDAAAEAVMDVSAMGSLSEEARSLILPIVTSIKGGVMSLESFDYALTVAGDKIESEGFLAIQEGSALRNLLKRAGEPGQADLAAYLPKESFVTFSGSLNPDWPLKEMKELLQKNGSEAVAAALLQFLSSGSVFAEALSGRSAGSMNLNMMAMAPEVTGLYELKPGVDAKKIFETLDMAKANEAMKKLGIPMQYKFEKAVGKHGETELHKLSVSSDDPQISDSLRNMTQYFAAENGMMFLSVAPTAEDNLKALIDRVRRGEKSAEHPHIQAMARLGRGHNLGFTVNVAALKPILQMFGMMMPPDVAQAVQRIPEVLTFSTAVTFPDGNLRWRGDWPAREIAKIVEQIRKAMPQQGGDGQPEEEEKKFD